MADASETEIQIPVVQVPSPIHGAAAVMLSAGVGYALGLLFAPRSGRETRAMIGNKAHEAQEKLKAKMGKTKEHLRRLAEQARQRAEELERQAQESS